MAEYGRGEVMTGKIRGNGLTIAMEAKKLGKVLELVEVETLSEGVVDELKGLGCTVDAIVQSWHRLRKEKEEVDFQIPEEDLG